MVNLQDENSSLQQTGCVLQEERAQLDRERKVIRERAIA